MIKSLNISEKQMTTMLNHLTTCLPEEGCGILAGLGNQVKEVITTTNELHSPTQYRIAAQDLASVFLVLDKNKLELVGIFHSHPNGPDYPSETDIKEFNYTNIPLIICNFCYNYWSVEAYQIQKDSFFKITIQTRK